jgi:DNA-binding beta-propeller fold protein YncE
MAVDAAHNVYLVDPFNNRVLRYDDPFGRDGAGGDHATIADAVWGQSDFSARQCNRGGPPAADSLCTGEVDRFYPNYYFASGLDVTPDGRFLWVADLGNHRVLRIPTAGRQADLVLGQPNFTTATVTCGSSDPRHLCKPNAVRYDPVSDRLYVLHGDARAARVAIFVHPTANHQPASGEMPPPPSGFLWPRGLTIDPTVPDGLWVTDTDNSRLLQYVGGELARVLSKGDLGSVGCIGVLGSGPLRAQVCNPHGSLGIDRDGSVYAGGLSDTNVVRYPAPIPTPGPDGVALSPDLQLLKDSTNYGLLHANRIGPSGLANPGAMALVGRQLAVADRKRIVFWNDYLQGSESGGPADGVLVQASFGSQEATHPLLHGPDFNFLAVDSFRQRLYAAQGPSIWAWDTGGGLRTGEPPAFIIEGPLPVRGGGWAEFDVWGIAIDERLDVAYITDQGRNRLLRVLRFSEARREVDLIIGQPTVMGGACNGGSASPVANGFCSPTQVRFDADGDLYVVDATWEGNGNKRVVAYSGRDLPPVPSPSIIAPASLRPSRIYSKTAFDDRACHPDLARQPCSPRAIAFEPGTNRMALTVDGYGNPLTSRLFVYDDPSPQVRAPGGTTRPLQAPLPDVVVGVPFNQPSDAAWDGEGRLLVLDHTWNRVVLFDGVPAAGE